MRSRNPGLSKTPRRTRDRTHCLREADGGGGTHGTILAERIRTQAYEGVVIARSNKGVQSNFTVRKLSYGEGVERVFPLYSPNVTEIQVMRRGKVRRAKLYYLRGRTGKSARIAEKLGMKAASPAKAAEG